MDTSAQSQTPQAVPVGSAIAPDEQGLAVATHLSGLAGYIVPGAGIVAPIVIWIVKSDSRIISSIAKQAVILNLAVFLLACVGFMMFLTVLLIPLALLVWLFGAVVALAFPIVGAIKASQGEYYRYPLVGSIPG